MRTLSKNAQHELDRMDWQIQSAKAVFLIRRYRSDHDDKWLVLAEKVLRIHNGYEEELEACQGDIIARCGDVLRYLGIQSA